MDMRRLKKAEMFSREEYYAAVQDSGKTLSEDALSYSLRKAVDNGVIMHVGRDQYAFADNKALYDYEYSEVARAVASEIQNSYPVADYRILELMQMNPFVNHQFAHNTVFVYVEKDLVEFVFDSLKLLYPGKILLKPTIENYYRYLVDDEIVVLRLPSESPKGKTEIWHSCIEKVLVDMYSDKILASLISESEYKEVYEEVFRRYYIDVKSMLRYARRKGAYDRYREILMKYAPRAIKATL